MAAEVEALANTSKYYPSSQDIDPTFSATLNADDDDNQSIISDAQSINSRNSLKKALSTISKLKRENSALHEALIKANAMDLVLLSTKLRGSHADLVRCKQTMSEMRDRIQVLEEKLFSALHSSQKHSTSIDIDSRAQSVKFELSDADRITQNPKEGGSADVLYYKKICASYKKRIEIMQVKTKSSYLLII
jgi:hypothetical protein